ncbi:MAG: efflux transporter outer membrane subunit [Alcaligenes sp.]
MSILRLVPALLCAALLSACFAPLVPELPRTSELEWDSQIANKGPVVELRAWWHVLGDPQLDALVQEALAQNLDLAQMVSRVQGERQITERWSSKFLPALNADAHPVQDVAAQDAYFHASLDMVWELGLFGAMENARLKAMADLGYAQADLQSMRVAVVAAVVRNYMDLAQARRQQALLEETTRLDEQALSLAQVRLQTHLGSYEAVEQAQLIRTQTQDQYLNMQERADRAARALALLLGRSQPDFLWGMSAQARLPQTFTLSQVPADLVRIRPDISMAQAEVLQAAAQLGVARSALYPRLRLGGSILYSYNITQNMRTSTDSVPSIGPMLDIPLWDWGARRARVRASERELDAALLGYRKAVVTAVSEVEQSLAALVNQQSRIQALQQANGILEQSQTRQKTLLGLGLSSEADLLQARRARLKAQADLELAQDSRVLAFVALYKALGGAPLPDEQEP